MLAAAAVVVVAACGTSHDAAPPQIGSIAGFGLALHGSTARLVVSAPDGTALLDGLDSSGDVGTPPATYANDDAPPMTGFAVRDVSTSYKMQFGSFDITDTPGAPWRVARSAQWDGAEGSPITLVDGSGATLATITPRKGLSDGHIVFDVEPGPGPERRFSWGFRCAPDDHFFGFGAQTWGTEAHGETIPIWVQEEGIGKDLTTDNPIGPWYLTGRRHSSGMPLPEYLSGRGYMLVAETNQLSTFALCTERADVARVELQMPVRVHLFEGPDPHDALGRMTAQFGRPRVPPAFAFAPWNDAIFGSENVRRVANKLRALGIPSSVIWTEDWRGGTWTGDHYALEEEWDVDRTLYPDFESVAQQLHGQGFKWLVYFNSFVEQDSKAWPETAPNGWLIKQANGSPYTFTDAKFAPASMLDLSNPAAVAWAVGKMQAAIALGADGWMGDYGEWLPTDATLAGGSGLDLHDLYPQLWQKAQRQALDAAIAKDGVERLSFVRSGWLGSPPLVDVFWPGDQRTDFEPDDGMPNVVPMGVGVGLSGISTYGSDIAGYQNATNGPVTKELFFRWVELGAWSPVMRTHHGSYPKLNWNWESDEASTQHWARYARLHVALAPYLRGLAQAAHDTGVSILRSLAVEFPGDGPSWSTADEWLLGPGVLVAPVQVQGATSRRVHFPPAVWYPWWGGAPVAGPGDGSVGVPLSEIAVFARAGTIVPTYPDGVQTLVREPSSAAAASTVGDDRVVYAFAGASGAFQEAPDASSAGPLSYTLTSAGPAPAGDASATWNGAALPACAAGAHASCFAAASDGVTAYVTGPGSLVVSRAGATAATLVASGGSATRTLTLIVRM